LFIICATGHPALAQDPQKAQVRIENGHWALEGDIVIITYDLPADPELTYDVGVVLTRESDANFRVVPKTVAGAIGKGKFAGLKKEIRWDYKKDITAGLTADDYQFDFSIQVVKEGSGTIWYILGVGLLGAGGAVAYQFLKNKDTGGDGISTPSGLPDAPRVRPSGQ
jgi:hypothetical protein